MSLSFLVGVWFFGYTVSFFLMLVAFSLDARLHDGELHGRKMYFPAYETIGRDVILSLNKEHDVPDGVLKLKTSEYWELKELAEVV